MFKWYNRKRKYYYGYYDKDNRVYYNEDSNKWVSRLNNKVIIEKYIRYEFSCYDDKKIVLDFGWSNIDRVGKYLFLIFKKSVERYKRYGDKWVYLDKINDEIKLLGNGKSKEIVNRLIELRLIESKSNRERYGKKIRLYKLNDGFFNCERRRVYIRNSKVIDLLNKRYNNLDNDDFIKWEIESCKKLNVIDDEKGRLRVIMRRLRKRIDSDDKELEYDYVGVRRKKEINLEWSEDRIDDYVKRCEINFDLLKSDILSVKEGGIEGDMFRKDKFGGRIYNVVCNKEKEFRSFLRLGKSNLVEIDMRNGYISLLCRVFKGIRGDIGINKFDNKIKEIVGNENGNDFLDMYEEVCFKGKDRIDFYEYVGISRLGMFGKVDKDERKYIKGLVLYLLNGKVDFSLKKRFIDEKYNVEELGEKIFGVSGWSCLKKIKSVELEKWEFYGFKSYLNMSKLLMSMEVIVMKSRWKELIKKKINYISLFDGFLVSRNEEDKVMNLMNGDFGIDNCISFRVDKVYNKKKFI